jgi:hypothetical protein
MRATQSATRPVQGYSVEDAAAFLEFDTKTIEYWLRMGHLSGDWNARRNQWEISPRSMLNFLRQASEPLPTGSAYRSNGSLHVSPSMSAETMAD